MKDELYSHRKFGVFCYLRSTPGYYPQATAKPRKQRLTYESGGGGIFSFFMSSSIRKSFYTNYCDKNNLA